MKLKAFFIGHIKIFKVIAAVIAFGLIAWIFVFTNALVGNPVSYLIVKNNAEKLVTEEYAAEGYVLEKVSYNFKFGNYTAHIVTPGSTDKRFYLSFDFFGAHKSGNYKLSNRLSGNVRDRLEMSYRALVDNVLESPSYPYSSYIAFGTLDFDYDENEGYLIRGITLVPDGIYDIAEVGANAGRLIIYVDVNEKATPEKAAEILLELNSLMKQGGATFYTIELTLESDNGGYIIKDFLRSDIYEDGLVERVKAVGLMTDEFNAKHDDPKKDI